MSSQLHNELKKEFQVERLILFSDAVFAIAITLLVIEIKVPELEHGEISDSALLHKLGMLVPKFIGFIVSFVLIGLYWTIHHRMFGFVTGYSKKLIVLNLFFLFTIVLMPFSTGIFGEYSTPQTLPLITPLAIYVFNACLTGLANYLLWRYIGNPANDIAGPFPEHFIRNAKLRSLMVPVMFLLMLLVAFWNPWIARYIPMLIPIATRLLTKKTKRPAQASVQ